MRKFKDKNKYKVTLFRLCNVITKGTFVTNTDDCKNSSTPKFINFRYDGYFQEIKPFNLSHHWSYYKRKVDIFKQKNSI